MDKQKYQELKNIDFHSAENLIAGQLRSIGFDATHESDNDFGLESSKFLETKIAIFALAYFYHDAKDDSNLEMKLQEAFQDETIVKRLAKMRKKYTDLIKELTEKYDKEILMAGVLFSEVDRYSNIDALSTPEGVADLAMELLEIEEKDTVLDLGSGLSTFLARVAFEKGCKNLHGVELNTANVIISRIRKHFFNGVINVHQGNILAQDYSHLNANKVFSHLPWGWSLRELKRDLAENPKLQEYFKDAKLTVSGDWLFTVAAQQYTESNGKTVVIMTNAGTWNKSDEHIRKDLLEKGLIEGVIMLTGNLFSNTGIPTTILILSEGNKSVKMVDASGIFTKGRRINTLEKKDVNEILKAYEGNTENSKTVTLKELKKNEYILNPQRYISTGAVIENGVDLGAVCKSIHRGAMISSRELDQLISDEKTEYRYIKLQNITEGKIDSQLPYLKTIEQDHEKHCLKDQNLIISKNSPYKVALVRINEEEKILASGNLYFIELDMEKVNPQFVALFLQSEKGMNELNRLAKGAAMRSISIQDLKRVQIPDVSIEEQNRVASEYDMLEEELDILQKQIDRIQERKEKLIQEVM